VTERTRATVGRLDLTVWPGEEARLLVADIGSAASPVPTSTSSPPWRFSPRGHPGSDWARGHLYTVTDFAVELARLLEAIGPQAGGPMLLEARGAGALVAALAALARPDLVRGLVLLADDGGWGGAPGLLVGPSRVLNRAWFAAVRAVEDSPASGLDPVLASGPPCSLPENSVRAALAGLPAPWWSEGGLVTDELLPPARRAARPPQ
jgi:pimeloyl-ACP methyl ester carboxylesterase